MTLHHTVKWTIEGGSFPAWGAVTCDAPEGSRCRMECVEGCWHECEHEKEDVGYCTAADWIDANGVPEHYSGPVHPCSDGPVDVWWDGDTWLWRYPEEDPVQVAAAVAGSALAVWREFAAAWSAALRRLAQLVDDEVDLDGVSAALRDMASTAEGDAP